MLIRILEKSSRWQKEGIDNMFDVKIGDYSMYEDFGLQALSIDPGSAEVDEKFKEIPGRNGDLDLTEVLTGFPVYKNATMKLSFDFKDGNYDLWLIRGSELKNKLHGRRMKVILGNDSFYYEGRVSVNTDKINKKYSTVEISVNRDPYKLEQYSSLDDYLWDDFNFENGIVREYNNLQVNGTLEVIIPGRAMMVVPVFDCSSAMTVTYDGIIYDLPKGKSRTPDLLLKTGDNKLTFKGNGTVSIDYRGGSL